MYLLPLMRLPREGCGGGWRLRLLAAGELQGDQALAGLHGLRGCRIRVLPCALAASDCAHGDEEQHPPGRRKVRGEEGGRER